MNTIIVDDDILEKEFSCEIPSGQHFIFDEFCLVFGEESNNPIVITVNAENGIDGEIYFNLLKQENEEINEIRYMSCPDAENSYDGLQVYCSVNEEQYTSIGHDLAQMVLRVMVYVLSTPRDKIEINSSNDGSVKKNNEKISRKNKNETVYLLSEIVEYVHDNNFLSQNKSTHKINCECWGVRGHYRHYKSGKVVFVKEYKKGKDRDKKEPQGKTYKV